MLPHDDRDRDVAAADVGPEGEAGLEVPEAVLPPRRLLSRGLLHRCQHASSVDVPWQGVAWHWDDMSERGAVPAGRRGSRSS